MGNKSKIDPAQAQLAASAQLPSYMKLKKDGSLEVHSNRLVVPGNVYDADFAWPQIRNGAISLFFAKASMDNSKIKTRVELRYEAEAFLMHFWKNSREFHDSLREWSQNRSRIRFDRSSLKIEPERAEPEKEHSFWANMDVMAQAEGGTCIDFYHLSPRGIAQWARGKDASGLSVEPVLRVLSTASELLHLLDLTKPLVDELESTQKTVTP